MVGEVLIDQREQNLDGKGNGVSGLGEGYRDSSRTQYLQFLSPPLTLAKNLISCSCGDFSTRPLLTTASVGRARRGRCGFKQRKGPRGQSQEIVADKFSPAFIHTCPGHSQARGPLTTRVRSLLRAVLWLHLCPKDKLLSPIYPPSPLHLTPCPSTVPSRCPNAPPLYPLLSWHRCQCPPCLP